MVNLELDVMLSLPYVEISNFDDYIWNKENNKHKDKGQEDFEL